MTKPRLRFPRYMCEPEHIGEPDWVCDEWRINLCDHFRQCTTRPDRRCKFFTESGRCSWGQKKTKEDA